MPTNLELFWMASSAGAVSFAGLLAGAAAGTLSRLPHERIAMSMSVGAGLLLAAASLKLTSDAIRAAGPVIAMTAVVLGAGAFSATNAVLIRFGAAHRKRCGECVQQPSASTRPRAWPAIALGNALDAAPEAVVLGLALRDPSGPVALAVTFSLSNFPAAWSSTTGMLAAGRSRRSVALLWGGVALAVAGGIAAGYLAFGALGEAWPPRLNAFGAGALLAMTAETMIPEAFHNGPRFSGLLAAVGFGLLVVVTAATR